MTDPVTIATRAFNTPLLMAPAKAAVIAQQLGPRLLGLGKDQTLSVDGEFTAPEARHRQPRPQAATMIGDELFHNVKRTGRGYSNIQGVAVIPIVGTLVRRGSYVGAESGVTSYEGISAQIRAAKEDDDARVVALEIDSFGGEAAGIFALAAEIRELREVKPVYAFIADYALSAGYAIASQADHITVPPFGEAGSIGVVSMHVDIEGQLEQQGKRVTLIHSGAHKVAGNPFEKLPENVRADIQKDNDAMWAGFAELVEQGRRGKVSIADALKTEAAIFRGQAAVAHRLVDQVGEARGAFAALLEQVNPPVVPVGGAGAIAPKQTTGTAQSTRATVPGLNVMADTIPSITKAGLPALETIRSPGCDTGAGAPSTKENDMPEAVTTTTTEPVAGPQTAAPDNGADNAPTDAQAAVAAERDRAAKITAKVQKAGLPASFASELIEGGATLEVAYEKILDAKAVAANDGGDMRPAGHTRVTSDGRDRTRQGMTLALLHKAGLEGGERNEFTSMNLREMARASLGAQGIVISAGGAMQLAGAAFAPAAASGGLHSTSDFTNILTDIANKAMLKGFDEAPEIFEQFTSVGIMGDFKPTKRVGLDAFPSLLRVDEGGEFKYGTMGDHGETAILGTYGRLFAITRQTIINDDLDALSKIPSKMGRAAKRTVGNLVFAVLNTNGALADGVALFHAGHKNLAASGGVPSEAAINAGITAMSTQTGNGKVKEALNIAPKFLLAPPSLRSVTLQSLNSEYAPDDTSKAGSEKQPNVYNTVKDAADPLFDARVADGSWFLLGDPNQYDTIEVGYLDGISTPWLDQQDGWTVDGTEFKVRLDACATALAHQAMYKNAGS
ncbi:S49 family peptidase [Shimia thalassica]|uniref:S49 family peptidase n=1 Tax=Shimia thalassica TaxID=1715693 RepID=UPI001C08C0D8|nr:S49 family peptidase [Shimia thalassica]MBU2941064.1 S49 family peptidase [Shimia thalassica]MDO6504209.1 S49 family peptidase [Shimia thalassica]